MNRSWRTRLPGSSRRRAQAHRRRRQDQAQVTEEVVLVPGLWMPAAIMAPLAARLAHAGYHPRRFAYSGRRSLEGAMERLARFTGAHFVGHSLGGVLILDMLGRHSEVRAGRIVLIGAPVSGCLAGRRLGASPVGRWMLGATTPPCQNCPTRWHRP